MDNKKKKSFFSYIAAALFFVLAFIDGYGIIYSFSQNWLSKLTILDIIHFIGTLIVAISVLSGKYKFSIYGLIIMSLTDIGYFIFNVLNPPMYLYYSNLVRQAGVICANILLLITITSKSSNRYIYGVISSTVILATYILGDALSEYKFFGVYTIALMFAYLFAGIAFGINANSNARETIPQNNTNKIDSLTRLKEMLDKGIITQEEFDEKKKKMME